MKTSKPSRNNHSVSFITRIVFVTVISVLLFLYAFSAYQERQLYLRFTINSEVADSSTLYYDNGKGFNANHRIDLRINKGITNIDINCTELGELHQLRWDPVFATDSKSITYSISRARWHTDHRLGIPVTHKSIALDLSQTKGNEQVQLVERLANELTIKINPNSNDPILYFHFDTPGLTHDSGVYLIFLFVSLILTTVFFWKIPVLKPSN